MPSGNNPIADFQSMANASKKWVFATGILLLLATVKPLRPLVVMTMILAVLLAVLQGSGAVPALEWLGNLFK